ncbi:MAG: hypothetical protein HRU15_05390 [Planctomycetes bacterium]|nr:hypothetical protein [Planctomycetota bacterium]
MRAFQTIVPLIVSSLCLGSMTTEVQAQDGSVSISRWNKNTLLINAPSNESVPASLMLKLQVRVTMDLQDVDLVDAIEHLQRITGVNIVIDPRLRSQDHNITLNVSNMKASTVVKWLKELSDCHVSYMHEAVYFSAEKVVGKNKIQIVDVSDLVMPINNFPGAVMNIPQPGSDGGSIFTDVVEEESPDTDDIIDVLEEILEKQGVEVE